MSTNDIRTAAANEIKVGDIVSGKTVTFTRTFGGLTDITLKGANESVSRRYAAAKMIEVA
jgi:hypothetical protein